jgi:hypothetical protein
MAIVHQLVEEPEEISDQKIPDVQAVDVGVGRQDHLFVAQVFDGVLDIEAAHEVVELVVFVDDIPLEVPDVQRFAPSTKIACVFTSRQLTIDPAAD